MDPAEWLGRYGDAIGVEAPTEEDVDVLLRLAGVAAHASERTAAPIACWMAARSGLDPVAALAAAERLTG